MEMMEIAAEGLSDRSPDNWTMAFKIDGIVRRREGSLFSGEVKWSWHCAGGEVVRSKSRLRISIWPHQHLISLSPSRLRVDFRAQQTTYKQSRERLDNCFSLR